CFGDDEIVDIEIVIVFGIGNSGLQNLLHFARDALARKRERGESGFGGLPPNRLRHKFELARTGADVAANRPCLRVRERPLACWFTPWRAELLLRAAPRRLLCLTPSLCGRRNGRGKCASARTRRI